MVSPVAVVALTALGYLVARAFYRLFLHPLAAFPGPRLAALTNYYEFYYNAVKNGAFIWRLQEMHEQYGPIVRVTPDELHISDPAFYDEIYAPSSRRRDKYLRFVAHFGCPTSMVATVDHDHHRLRRGFLNPFFSKRSVVALEAVIRDKALQLAWRLEQAYGTGEVVRLDAAFTALTMDVITHYSYGSSYDYLAEPDFKESWKTGVLEASANGATLRQWPALLPVFRSIPPWLLKRIDRNAGVLLEIQHLVRSQCEVSLKAKATGKQPGKSGSGEDGERAETIFDALMDPSVPPKEKTMERLQDEGQLLLGAGSETTANTLTVLSFHVLNDKTILEKLRDELKTVMPTPISTPTWTQLEQLPYLSAVIAEGLRLSYGVTTRLPRVAPTETLSFRTEDGKEWLIPPGTPVSTASYFVHTNPKIYPSPHTFRPERWLEANQRRERLDRFLVAFTKGSRACLGINLAYAELYLTVATVFRRFELDLYDTDEGDVELRRDLFFAWGKEGSKGVRARVVGVVHE